MEMCRKTISKRMREFLIIHLSEIEKKKEILLKKHYSDNVRDSMEFEESFKEYCKTVHSYLNNAEVEDLSAEDESPFVIIGSIVEVEDIEDKETYKYRIVLPYEKTTDHSEDCASCISPLGKALLLKTAKQRVDIKIPTGTLSCIIRRITLPKAST
jgi:transcription elongation factor GreA